MSEYQENLTVDGLIEHLQAVSAAGHGAMPIVIAAYLLDPFVRVDARPDFPRGRAFSAGRIPVGQTGYGQRSPWLITVVMEDPEC